MSSKWPPIVKSFRMSSMLFINIHTIYIQGFFPNANLPGNDGFSSPPKMYLPPKIEPSSPPKYFLFYPSPIFFSSTFDHTIFFRCLPRQTRFHGKNPRYGFKPNELLFSAILKCNMDTLLKFIKQVRIFVGHFYVVSCPDKS